MNTPFDQPGSGDARPRRFPIGNLFGNLALRGLPLLLGLVLLLVIVAYHICTYYIEPDQFAVKQVDVPMPFLTGVAGIHTNIYDTGIRWRLPGCEKFIVFPKNIRAVTLHAKSRSEGDVEKYVRY